MFTEYTLNLIEEDMMNVKGLWDNDIFINGAKTNSCGVAILLNNNSEYEVLFCKKDKNGNYLNLLLKLSSMTINLITLYGPNNDFSFFFEEIQTQLENVSADYNIFNVALNPDLDTCNYKHVNNPKAKQAVLDIMREHDLSDIYRELHPNTKQYTWNPVKHARLDLFLASSNILDITNNCEIRISCRSDHSVIELDLMLNQFSRGKGLWKFNNSLLECADYLNIINNVIEEEKLKHAVPVYDLSYLENKCTKFERTIDHHLFLETLFL